MKPDTILGTVDIFFLVAAVVSFWSGDDSTVTIYMFSVGVGLCKGVHTSEKLDNLNSLCIIAMMCSTIYILIKDDDLFPFLQFFFHNR